jgi:thiol-disulfide isomerase/thioredoxin
LHPRASEEDKASQRSSAWNRVWDAIAILAIVFVVWKVFVAPRGFNAPGTHPAPHAVYPLINGGTFRIADERGRVVFLDFFATWCEPCKVELPLVERWRHSHPGAVVLFVDVGESRAAAAAFARRYSLGDVALDEPVGAPALFGVHGFPTIVVIDPSGHIRAKWEGLNPAIGLAMTHAAVSLTGP